MYSIHYVYSVVIVAAGRGKDDDDNETKKIHPINGLLRSTLRANSAVRQQRSQFLLFQIVPYLGQPWHRTSKSSDL